MTLGGVGQVGRTGASLTSWLFWPSAGGFCPAEGRRMRATGSHATKLAPHFATHSAIYSGSATPGQPA
eukprot:5848802-Pyramimonas_sp.AAC.1